MRKMVLLHKNAYDIIYAVSRSQETSGFFVFCYNYLKKYTIIRMNTWNDNFAVFVGNTFFLQYDIDNYIL